MAPYVRAHRCKPCRTSLSEIAGRLALTRRVLDLTRFQLARLLGADMPARGAYEAGLERIPADQALKLSAYGIPLDWDLRVHQHIRAKNSPARKLKAVRARRSPSRRANVGYRLGQTGWPT